MSGYLQNYGAGEERRERIIKRLALSALAVSLVALAGWWFFRNWKEESQIKSFLALLANKDYKSAYALWGCTEATPCRDYSYARFMEDWGPASPAANLSGVHREKVKSCEDGIIQVMRVKEEEVLLYVDRVHLQLSFAPWPVCNPKVKM